MVKISFLLCTKIYWYFLFRNVISFQILQDRSIPLRDKFRQPYYSNWLLSYDIAIPTFRVNIKTTVWTNVMFLQKDATNIDEKSLENENDNDIENWEKLSAELLLEDDDDGLNDGDWLPDREIARLQKETLNRDISALYSDQLGDSTATNIAGKSPETMGRPSPYTDEEEEIIAAMGGKGKRQKRESGFLGDSTLMEICSDYSVPISYLADVLCMWGVPIPIHVHDKLGDLVTGEQAFAIVEAVNTLDVAALHDRYSNTNLQQLCYEWEIDLQQAFEMAMKEGWSLPFGVQTCLRTEQERELLRTLGSQSGLLEISNDENDDDF